jgi:hypothetical protein
MAAGGHQGGQAGGGRLPRAFGEHPDIARRRLRRFAVRRRAPAIRWSAAPVRDPLAEQALEAEGLVWAAAVASTVARARCGGRIVSSLAGGYDLQALGQSALAHVRALGEG